MKKWYVSIIFICLFINSLLTGKIVETQHFKDVLDYVSPSTLLVIDVDDTLLVPTQTLGSDVWFVYRLEQLKAQSQDQNYALDRALAEWEAVRHLTGMKIVEEGTDRLIASLQTKNIALLGLTTQGLALATRTVEQLQAVGIDLSKGGFPQADVYFQNDGHGVLFRHGVLFTSGTKKGRALQYLLDKMDCHPSRVVFINDKLSHLKDVEDSIGAMGIEFIGLRYSHEDGRVAKFNKDIAEIQWNCSSFNHILSDEEALQILKRRHMSSL